MQQNYLELVQQIKSSQTLKQRSFQYNQIITVLKNYKFKPQPFQGDELYEILIEDIKQITQQQKATKNTLIYLNSLCLTLQQFISPHIIKKLYDFVSLNIFTIENLNSESYNTFLQLFSDILEHLESSKFDPRKDDLDLFEIEGKRYSLQNIINKLTNSFDQVLYENQHLILNIMYLLIQRSPSMLYRNISFYLNKDSLPIKFIEKQDQDHFIISLLIFSSSLKELSGYFYNATISDSLRIVKSDQQGQQVLFIYQLIQNLIQRNQNILIKQNRNKNESIIAKQIDKCYENFLQQINIYKIKPSFSWIKQLTNEELKYKYLQITLKNIIDQIERCPMASSKIQQFWIDLINNNFNEYIQQATDILVYYYQNQVYNMKQQQQVEQDDDFGEIFDQNQKQLQLSQNNQFIYNATILIATYLSIYPVFPCIIDMFGQTCQEYKNYYLDQDNDDIFNKFTYIMKQMINVSQNKQLIKEQKLLILKYLISFTYTYQYGVNIHLQPQQSNLSKLQLKYINSINSKSNLMLLQLNFVTRYLNESYQTFILPNIIISASNGFYDQIQFSIIADTLEGLIDQIQPEQYSLLTDTVNAELDYFINSRNIKESLFQKLTAVIQAHQTLIKSQYFIENQLLIDETYNKYITMLTNKNMSSEMKKHVLQNIQVVMIYTDKCCPQNVLDTCLQLASRYSRCQSEALRVFRYVFKFLDNNLQIYDIDIQQIIQSFIFSLSTNEQTAYSGVSMIGMYYQYVELYQQGKCQQQSEQNEKQLLDLVEQTFKSVTDKLFDYFNLYPKTLNNQMRSKQIIKQITCINKTLSQLPTKYFQQQRIFSTVSYCYNEFAQLFQKYFSIMFDSQVLLIKIIQIYKLSEFKLKFSKGNILQQSIQYLDEQIQKYNSMIKQQNIYQDENVDIQQLQEQLNNLQEIRQKL